MIVQDSSAGETVATNAAATRTERIARKSTDVEATSSPRNASTWTVATSLSCSEYRIDPFTSQTGDGSFTKPRNEDLEPRLKRAAFKNRGLAILAFPLRQLSVLFFCVETSHICDSNFRGAVQMVWAFLGVSVPRSGPSSRVGGGSWRRGRPAPEGASGRGLWPIRRIPRRGPLQ